MASNMNENNNAVNTDPTAAQDNVVDTQTTETQGDVQTELTRLEDERNKAIEEAANWKVAALKAKGKNKSEDVDLDETEDERIARIVNEKLSEKKIADIDAQKDALLKKALKENKELKLAHMNKTSTPPAGLGTHSESFPVKDTAITPEQLAAFKARGWTEKDIERYKKNLNKYGGR